MADVYTRDAAQVTVTVNGQTYQGWLQSEVSFSLEAISGTFSIPVSLDPGNPPAIQRQDEVVVHVGKTQVLKGYVIAAGPFYGRNDCGMRITGRDRTGDLVHCSAIHKGGQWRGAQLDRIVKDLLGPFSIGVVVETDLGAAIADFKINHGETVLDALSRACRLRGVMLSRDAQGRVVLCKAGTKLFAGQIQRGVNVISMEDIGTDEQRHSHYMAYGQSNCRSGDFEGARQVSHTATDSEIKRYLPLVLRGEGNHGVADLTALAQHTARVRRGHSMGLRYVVEGWTWKGEPWPLNQRAVIRDDIAGVAGDAWLITSVRHTCTLQDGDVTELVVRPVEAYDTVPLKTRVVHRNYGNKGNTTNHPKGPSDGH